MTIVASARLAAGLFLAAGLSTAAVAQPQISVRAHAAQGIEVQSRPVGFGDLDLRSEAGRDRLENRLKVAAGTVCGKRSLWTVRPPADYTRCYDNVMTSARAELQQRVALGDTRLQVASN